jgi:hypothetical protein
MVRFVLAAALVAPLAGIGVAAPPSNPDPKALAVPPEQLSKARELVQKLASDAFIDRERAQEALAEMGRLARPALLDGARTDPDPEIRQRCQALLPKATAAEMKARLAAFLADADGKFDHDLPGWNKLRAAVRGEFTAFGWTWAARPSADKTARALFTEFLSVPGGSELLSALDRDRGTAGQVVAARKQELYNARFPRNGTPGRNPSVAEVAVVMFAESQVPAKNVPRATALTSVITASGLSTAVQNDDDRGRALKAVMTAWFDSRTEGVDMYSALTLANNMNNTQAAGRLAGRLLTVPGVTGFYRGQAMSTIVRLKMTEQLPAVEKAFGDQAVISTTIRVVNGVQVRQTTEVRDAALATAVLLTGQDPAAYHFESLTKGTTTFTYTQGRIAEGKRDEAFAKWKEWREKNP